MSGLAALLRQFTRGARAISVPDFGRLERIGRIDCIVVVGASGTGKSTLVDAVRASHLAAARGPLAVPPRFVTRPMRDGDNDKENVFLSAEDFERRLREGEMGLHWERRMEGRRVERYGFPVVPPQKLPVYSANNALQTNAESVRPPDALAQALFIGAYAPDPVREERLLKRSPELWRRAPEELKHRLSDKAEGVFSRVHVVVENHGDGEEVAPIEVVQLIARIAEHLG